jgi:hypothetical protein
MHDADLDARMRLLFAQADAAPMVDPAFTQGVMQRVRRAKARREAWRLAGLAGGAGVAAAFALPHLPAVPGQMARAFGAAGADVMPLAAGLPLPLIATLLLVAGAWAYAERA